MKRQSPLAMAGLCAALLLTLSLTTADAQRGRRGGRGNNNNNTANGTANGTQNAAATATQGGPGAAGAGGPGMAMAFGGPMGMMGGNMVEPARSAKMMLIYREDVQTELNIDLNQKAGLDDLKGTQAQNQQKMMQEMRTTFQSLGQQAQSMTPEERQAKMQEIQGKVQGMVQTNQDDLDKRINDILKPKQRKRLNELDLRWRGQLALVDPKVADPYTLSTDEKKRVTDAYKAFTDARQALVMSMMPANIRARFQQFTAAGANGAADPYAAQPPAATATPATPATPEEQKAAQQKAMKNFEKTRIALGDKLMTGLPSDKQKMWTDAIGERFRFRDLSQ